ncbi:helix-turn-helix transcriptional regulator [Solihabitans fulvus]|uniref:Helix-turn-helix transcriptional regulator n=2 Tax=Solihabitans fulvus TaxID=1892852 RepID=A0A5B2WPM5_9PSEU|nr:helix-turn-helix transcriptional regulator [Solihabitans fulvus]
MLAEEGIAARGQRRRGSAGAEAESAVALRRQKILGEVLRDMRKVKGWTRKVLVERMGRPVISLQTLATYELGTRECSVTRLCQICAALDVHAHEILRRVHEQLPGEEPPHGQIRLDLPAIVADNHRELRPLRDWARRRLDQMPFGAGTDLDLEPSTVESLAQLCQVTTGDLIALLRALRARSSPSAGKEKP